MLIFTRENYTIPELIENQALVGYCSTSQTYEITMRSDDPEATAERFIGTISNVKFVKDPNDAEEKVIDTQVSFYPCWGADGPIDATKTVNVQDIAKARHVYVHFSSDFQKGRRRVADQPGQKSWVFRFSRNELVLTPKNFIKIIYRDDRPQKENRRPNHAIFGTILDVSKNDKGIETVTIKELCGYHGMFGFEEHKLPISNIQSIFHCTVEVSDFVRKKDAAKPAVEEASEETLESAT